MYNYGIVICLDDSENLLTIDSRVNKLFNKYEILKQRKHPDNPTTGCFYAHMKALVRAIEIMNNNDKYEYIIIAEEDIIIDYESKYYKNIEKSINNYNKDSNYILHLGGFPMFGIDTNMINKDDFTINSRIYLLTCYAVNVKIAKKILYTLKGSSKHIHCDAIVGSSLIKQRLVKGNLVNQLFKRNSINTLLHNIISTKSISNIFLILYKFRYLFIQDDLYQILLLLFSIMINKKEIYYIELCLLINDCLRKLFIHKTFNKYLRKDIFIYLESFYLTRLVTYYYIYKECNNFLPITFNKIYNITKFGSLFYILKKLKDFIFVIIYILLR